jgi:hypothetical protein
LIVALVAAFALGDLLPQRMGGYRLQEPPVVAKGVYSGKRQREATLLITETGGISCVSTASVRAARQYVDGRRGCLFLATEIDPHIAPLVLAWPVRGFVAWLTLTKAGFDNERAAKRRALRAAQDAQRWMERVLSGPRR